MSKQEYNVSTSKYGFTSMLKTTEEQVSTEYPAEQQYICMHGQHQKFENTLQFLYQKKTKEIKELKKI